MNRLSTTNNKNSNQMTSELSTTGQRWAVSAKAHLKPSALSKQILKNQEVEYSQYCQEKLELTIKAESVNREVMILRHRGGTQDQHPSWHRGVSASCYAVHCVVSALLNSGGNAPISFVC